MELLILGGTSFLGRHVAATALDRGHRVTLFHRGRTNPGLFGDAEAIHGDRKTDLHLLDGRTWDAVVDTCGYLPKVVHASVVSLQDRVALYAFVSSISVYPTEAWPNVDEDSPTLTCDDPDAESVTPETYGALKAACDEEVLRRARSKAFVVRPGLIVGPHDPTDRFTYWVRRVSEGGEVLAPEPRDRRTKWIDARDLAEWICDSCELARTGVYNAIGPEPRLTMESFLHDCRGVSGSDARFTWVGKDFLDEHGVQPWSDLPLWIPGIHDDFNCSRAIEAGLRFRAVSDTIRDTLWWDERRDRSVPMKAGITRAKERELLDAWARRSG